MTKKAKGKDKTARPTRASREEIKLAAIRAFEDKRTGRIVPDDIWRAAKDDPNHVLHNEFEWDIQKAAETQWRETARELIRWAKFTVVVEKVKHIIPYYVSDPRTEDSAYVATLRIARKPEVAERELREELGRIESAINRARKLAVAFGMQSKLERLLDEVVNLRRSIEDELSGDNDQSMQPTI